MGASKCMGAYGHPLSLTKHAFFVLCMYRGHPNIIKTYGGIQIYRDVQTYREAYGDPNIQWTIQTYGDIQKYRGIQTWGAPLHTGGIQTYGASKCMGAYGHPLVWPSMFSLCCACTEGIQRSGGTTFFVKSWTISASLNCASCFLFILNILSIFQNIPLSFTLCVDRNSLLWGVLYIVLYFACCCKISFLLFYLKSDDDLILNI